MDLAALHRAQHNDARLRARGIIDGPSRVPDDGAGFPEREARRRDELLKRLGVLRKFDQAEPRDPHTGEWLGVGSGLAGDIAEKLAKALTKQDALDATPAKLKRAPGGHHGNYDGEALAGPKGMGSVRALSEYEGVEYSNINGYLRDPKRYELDNDPLYRDDVDRVAEIDKTMSVSRLTADVKVDRVVKEGALVFGRDAWYGDIIDWSNSSDFDQQDREAEIWRSGVRPDLTGLRWKELGYSSTTADAAVAKDFGKRWPALNRMNTLTGEPVIMTILVPKGTGGVQLAEMGHAAEILLQRDLTFEIVADHGVDADGFRRIQVRVVPDGEQ